MKKSLSLLYWKKIEIFFLKKYYYYIILKLIHTTIMASQSITPCVVFSTDPARPGTLGDIDDIKMISMFIWYILNGQIPPSNLLFILPDANLHHPHNIAFFERLTALYPNIMVVSQADAGNIIQTIPVISHLFIASPIVNAELDMALYTAIVAGRVAYSAIQGDKTGYNFSESAKMIPNIKIGELLGSHINIFSTPITKKSINMSDITAPMPPWIMIHGMLKLVCLLPCTHSFAPKLLISKDVHRCGGSGSTIQAINSFHLPNKLDTIQESDRAFLIGVFSTYRDNLIDTLMAANPDMIPEVEIIRLLVWDALLNVANLVCYLFTDPKMIVNPETGTLHTMTTISPTTQFSSEAPVPSSTPFLYDAVMLCAIKHCPDGITPQDFAMTPGFMGLFTNDVNHTLAFIDKYQLMA
jgi:hypothetical protein